MLKKEVVKDNLKKVCILIKIIYFFIYYFELLTNK